MIREVRKATALPIAVITNGSHLSRPKVREELSAADAVMPTLDAGSAGLHARLNRPHPDLEFESFVSGLVDFRAEYPGKLWVEVMLVRDLNDDEESLDEIARCLRRIRPDAVHVNLPTRCPSESWVRPADEAGLDRATRILGETATVVRPAEGTFDVGGGASPVEAVVDIVTRHPMRHSELLAALRERVPGREGEVVRALEADGRVRVVERSGERFWRAARGGSSGAARGRPR
jgi:wyosine [tRNA(Phe)-imidazoG37] synthetase (radical SAM superfamily)